MEINAYGSQSVNDTKDLIISKGQEPLGMQDFLNLLVVQMTNQDALNPMDNTEFISQMAQFSSLQAMSDMSTMTMQNLATSLIGKNVVVAEYDNFGKLIINEGIVQKVTIYGGKTKLFINDEEYDYSNVMEIKQPEAAEEKEDPVPGILQSILNSVDGLKRNEDTTNEDITDEDTIEDEDTVDDVIGQESGE